MARLGLSLDLENAVPPQTALGAVLDAAVPGGLVTLRHSAGNGHHLPKAGTPTGIMEDDAALTALPLLVVMTDLFGITSLEIGLLHGVSKAVRGQKRMRCSKEICAGS